MSSPEQRTGSTATAPPRRRRPVWAWLLLALLAVPIAVALYLLAQRRRARYAVVFTNLEVLAAVAGGRSWRRLVAPILALLSLAALCAALARPHVETLVPRERATVVLVVDVSR